MKTLNFANPRKTRIIFLLATAAPLIWDTGTALGNESESKPKQNTIAVWDTESNTEAPTPAMLTAKRGWRQISAPDTPSSFKGDAVISNGRIIAAVRHQSPSVEVYAEGSEGPVSLLRLMLT